ncbi:MAG TPA: hypothetical protein VMU47_08280 [Caldimonas sp.]|nr:hypothetical protein [Caldimonas sp.]
MNFVERRSVGGRPALLLAGLALGLACSAVDAKPRTRVLETFRYRVTITIPCAEREPTCNQVGYRALDKRSGGSQTLTGHTEHEMCADGHTPCRFLGYAFARGSYRYFVSEGGELIVNKGKKEVLRELGHWQH